MKIFLSCLIGLTASAQIFAQATIQNCNQITNNTSSTIYKKCGASGSVSSVWSHGGQGICCAGDAAPDTLYWSFSNTDSTTWNTLALSCSTSSMENLKENRDINGSSSDWEYGTGSCTYTRTGGF